jgi:hypothetical protein
VHAAGRRLREGLQVGVGVHRRQQLAQRVTQRLHAAVCGAVDVQEGSQRVLHAGGAATLQLADALRGPEID